MTPPVTTRLTSPARPGARRGPLLAALLAAALLGATLLAPAAALAQRAAGAKPASSARPAIDVARLAAALDAPTRDSLSGALLQARRLNLPTEPLLAKALEGVEKGAPGVRIQNAVRQLLRRLVEAREGLAPVASDVELAAGADAIAVGVPASALRALRALSPRRSTATALGVLAQLVSRGVPVSKAEATVKQLLQRGGGDQQLLALERTVNGDIALGLTPDAALELNSKAILAALPVAPAAAPGGATTADQGVTSLNGGPRSRP